MVVNDDAGHQVYRRDLKTIASKARSYRDVALRTDVRGFHDRVKLLRIATLLT